MLQAYRDFEYHAIFHALFNFFTIDLSAFYLNIQKDNLYCNRPRRPASAAPAQQAVFTLLRETLLLMAPILSFTCEEAWGFVPDYPGKEPFIHLERFPAGRRTTWAAAWTTRAGRGSWPSATAS